MTVDKNEVAVGAVIVFKPHVDAAQAQKVLDALIMAGYIHRTEAKTYDPNWGSPVWYIP